MNRRNGKPQSCEPCRKSKIKCDHTLPICEKCKARKIIQKCFYHPAPLTRRHGEPRSGTIRRSHSGPPNGNLIQISTTVPHAVHTTTDYQPAPSNHSTSLTPNNSAINDSGFQTASYAASGRLSEVLSSQASTLVPGYERARPDLIQIESGSKLVALLHPFSVIQNLIHHNFLLSQIFSVAAPLVLGALPHVKSIVERRSSACGGSQNDALSLTITQNTLRPFIIPSSIKARDFHTLFTEENLRWEFIGFIFACAGRSAIVKPANSRIFVKDNGEVVNRDTFCHDMMMASRTCVALCRDNGAVVNDLLIWLLYENLVFSTTHYGDSSPLVWQRLGDLSTDIYSMGLHREPQNPDDIPFFIQECRRKMYAAAYRSDKVLATYLGRPPRIPKQYSDVKPPLDISDETLMAEGPRLQEVLSSLDETGWDPEGQSRPAAFIRLRYIMSAFREEILELSLGAESMESDAIVHKLNDISRRSGLAWDALPDHLHYNPSCWEDGRTPGACLILLSVYLDRLNSDFHIQRILCKHSQEANPALLSTSNLMLATVMVLIKQYSLTQELRRDYAWIVLFYGVSSAGVLAAELSRCTRTSQFLPTWLSRSELIRNLSVLISYLEWVTRPGDGNYAACSEASKMLARLLDEALESQISIVANQQSEQPVLAPAMDEELLEPVERQMLLEGDGIGDEGLPMDSEAFLAWFDSVDWNHPMGI